MSTEKFAGKPIIDPAFSDDNQSNSVTKRVDGKLVLRPSSLNIHCPYSYAQNAILGKKSKPSGASAGGTAYHYALELGYSQMIADRTIPSSADLVEIGVLNWKKAQEHNDLHYSATDSASKMTDDIAKGIANYYPTMAKVKPIATEIRWSTQLPKASSVYSVISGSVDLLVESTSVTPVLGGGVEQVVGTGIVDHKFTTKKATSPKYRFQAGLYRMMGESNGYTITGTALHNSVRSQVLKTKTNPVSLEIVRPTWNNSTVTGIVSRVNELIDRAEIFHFMTNDLNVEPDDAVKVLYATTTPETSFLCNELWCGWWHTCPMNNAKDMTNLNLVEILRDFSSKRG